MVEVIQLTEETYRILNAQKQYLKEEFGEPFAYSDIIQIALKYLKEKLDENPEEVYIELASIKARRMALHKLKRKKKRTSQDSENIE
ncbi:hypothetical protein [Thermococcus sp. GR6]|uniref:hypothetical protein n=1 Tax=Thermococcus sp. GR6 TaxID=1638256 RepID=UPI0014322D38|nr:hypothetical protein [Thermococcus sp. GR6]NJE41856.1 hypothetical protein [Thermococcus sp. GR6]